MAQIENLPLVLTGLGLTASILYYTMTLRNANKTQQLHLETRQAQLFMQVYDRFNQGDYWNYDRILESQTWNDYDDFCEKYGSNNREAYEAFCSLASYFDGLGVLIKRELIDISLVDDLLHSRLLWFWNKYGDIIKEMRKKGNNPRKWPHIIVLQQDIGVS